MKKSRIKYVGLVAAALLAAAPIAAGVVTTIAAPVYAADETPTPADVDKIRAEFEDAIAQGKKDVQTANDTLVAIQNDVEKRTAEINQKFSDAQINLPTARYARDQAQAAVAEALQEKSNLGPDASADEIAQAQAKYDAAVTTAREAVAKLDEYQSTVDQAQSTYQAIIATGQSATKDTMDKRDKAEAAITKAQDKLDGFTAAGTDASTGVPEKTDAELADKTQGYRDVYHDAYKLATKLIENGKKAAQDALQTAIRNGKNLINGHGDEYTPDTVSQFQQALDAATDLLNSDKATVAQLTDAGTDLGKAAGDLAKPTTPTKPVTPTEPTTPTKPVTPTEPTTPTTPVTPTEPGTTPATDIDAIIKGYKDTVQKGKEQIKQYDQKLADVAEAQGYDQKLIEDSKIQAEIQLDKWQKQYDSMSEQERAKYPQFGENVEKGRAQIGEYDQILEKIAAAKDIDTAAIKDSKDKAQKYIDIAQAQLDGFNAAGVDADAGALPKTDADLAGKPAGYIDGYRQGYQLAADILNFSAIEKAAKADVDNGTRKADKDLAIQGPLYTKLYNNYYDAIQGVYAGTTDGKKGQKQDLTGKSAAYQRGYNEAYAQYYQAPTTPTKPVTPTYPTTPGTTPIETVDTLTESPASGIAYVTAQAGIPLYSDKETTNQIGRTLAANSSWKIFGKVTNSAGTIVAYNLGGKQYVKASDITLTNPVTKGTFTVRYSEHPTWGIAVYNGALKVQKIIPAGSRWATYGKKTINGQEYYSLGGDQYARADYGSWIAD